MPNLKEIYDDIVSTYAQYSKIHDKFLMLNWHNEDGGGFSTTETSDVMQNWMIDDSDNIQGLIGKLSDKLWALPEVNKNE